MAGAVVDDGVVVVELVADVVVVDCWVGALVDDVEADVTVVSGVSVVVVTGTRTAGTSSVGGDGSGRTARYSTSVARNAPASTSVEVRGRPVMARGDQRSSRAVAP